MPEAPFPTRTDVMQRADAALQSNQPSHAIDVLQHWLSVHPDDCAGWVALSSALSRNDDYRKARMAAASAANVLAADASQLLPVALRLRTFSESGLIRSLCANWRLNSSDDSQLCSDMAAMLSAVGDQPFALSLLNRALVKQPKNPRFRFNRAQVLSYFGRIQEAEDDLQACLRAAPEFAQAHWLQSRLRRQTSKSNHVATLRRLLLNASLAMNARAFLGFALHKELDDLGEHEQAWSALQNAWAAKRTTLQYRSADTRALFAHLRTARVAPAHVEPRRDGVITPIFIVGMHRSGTSLLERMLSGHSRIAAAGELYDFPAQLRLASNHHGRGALDLTVATRLNYADFAVIGEGYLQATQWRRGAQSIFTDKLPSNFVNLGYIAMALPHARFLHVVRHPLDTGLSNLRELFSDACPYSYDQQELGEYYDCYRKLMQHWHSVLPGRIHDIGYEAMVTAPDTTIDRALQFIGLSSEQECIRIEQRSAAVATASSGRIHGAIDQASVGAWKRYATQLQPLSSRLAADGWL